MNIKKNMSTLLESIFNAKYEYSDTYKISKSLHFLIKYIINKEKHTNKQSVVKEFYTDFIDIFNELDLTKIEDNKILCLLINYLDSIPKDLIDIDLEYYADKVIFIEFLFINKDKHHKLSKKFIKSYIDIIFNKTLDFNILKTHVYPYIKKNFTEYRKSFLLKIINIIESDKIYNGYIDLISMYEEYICCGFDLNYSTQTKLNTVRKENSNEVILGMELKNISFEISTISKDVYINIFFNVDNLHNVNNPTPIQKGFWSDVPCYNDISENRYSTEEPNSYQDMFCYPSTFIKLTDINKFFGDFYTKCPIESKYNGTKFDVILTKCFVLYNLIDKNGLYDEVFMMSFIDVSVSKIERFVRYYAELLNIPITYKKGVNIYDAEINHLVDKVLEIEINNEVFIFIKNRILKIRNSSCHCLLEYIDCNTLYNYQTTLLILRCLVYISNLQIINAFK